MALSATERQLVVVRSMLLFTHVYLHAQTAGDASDICTWRITVILITGKPEYLLLEPHAQKKKGADSWISGLNSWLGELHPKPKTFSMFVCYLKIVKTFWKIIDPFPNTSAPARLRLPVPHVSTKPLKSSLSLHAKILFYIWNKQIKYCKRYHYEVNRCVLHVNC